MCAPGVVQRRRMRTFRRFPVRCPPRVRYGRHRAHRPAVRVRQDRGRRPRPIALRGRAGRSCRPAERPRRSPTPACAVTDVVEWTGVPGDPRTPCRHAAPEGPRWHPRRPDRHRAPSRHGGLRHHADRPRRRRTCIRSVPTRSRSSTDRVARVEGRHDRHRRPRDGARRRQEPRVRRRASCDPTDYDGVVAELAGRRGAERRHPSSPRSRCLRAHR